MGRPYREELDELQSAAEGPAAGAALGALVRAFEAACVEGLVVVASGGALVVAEWACQLVRQASGRPAVALTPLQFHAIGAPIACPVWLLSAAGRHADIRAAAARALARGDRTVQAIIGRAGSALAGGFDPRAGHAPIELGFEVADGFLATYSVWHMARLLAAAASQCNATLAQARASEALAWGLAAGAEFPVSGAPSEIVLVHDAWTALGAHDLQTRVTETALAPAWRTDWRNLGHGRHFWLAARAGSTHLVALHTPASQALADVSLDGLPAQRALTRVTVPWDGPTGALAALAWSMRATAQLAEPLGRDPGRPGVPAFGERLYAGGFPYPAPVATSRRATALARKGGCGAEASAAWAAAHGRLARAPLRGVVFDFDGTLVATPRRFEPIEPAVGRALNRLLDSGLRIGVATGRGDSVQARLMDAIAPSHHDAVIVGYHNGRLVQPLRADTRGLDAATRCDRLARGRAALEARFARCERAEVGGGPDQITLRARGSTPLDAVWRIAREVLALERLELDVWLSSHSVDVVVPGAGKVQVVDALAQRIGTTPDAILRIGDRGAWPGNDWQMLAHPLGLSVDTCTDDPATCWNLLPTGMHGVEGTLWLLERLRVTDGVGRFALSEHDE